MRQLTLVIVAIAMASISFEICGQVKNQQAVGAKVDTLNSFKYGGYWVTPKESFEFISFIDLGNDTLGLVACGENVYAPFGPISSNTQLKSSNLSNFRRVDKVEAMNNEKFEFQKLSLKSSRIILFFDDDPESSKHSYILKGEIFDDQVQFDKNLKVGISKGNFIATFFEVFPEDLLNSYSAIVFESCVTTIRHIYTFKNSKLESVKFLTDSYWNVDYD